MIGDLTHPRGFPGQTAVVVVTFFPSPLEETRFSSQGGRGTEGFVTRMEGFGGLVNPTPSDAEPRFSTEFHNPLLLVMMHCIHIRISGAELHRTYGPMRRYTHFGSRADIALGHHSAFALCLLST